MFWRRWAIFSSIRSARSVKKIDEANAATWMSTAIASAMIGATLFMSVIGAFFKIVGEALNPHSSLRYQAIEIRSKRWACIKTFQQGPQIHPASLNGIGLLTGVCAYATARLAEAQEENEAPEAVARDCQEALANLWLSPDPERPQLTNDQAYEFCNLLVRLRLNLEGGGWADGEPQRLRAIIANLGDRYLAELSGYIDHLQAKNRHFQDLKQLGLVYNQIMDQMSS